MPLTKKGKEILKTFKKRYNRRYKQVFYAYINKYPQKTKSWHK